MKRLLSSLALVTLATMSITVVNAGAELRESRGMSREKSQCSLACKAHCARIKAIIAKFEDPTDRAEFTDVLKHKHCMWHKLSWLKENSCQKCQNMLEQHESRIKTEKGECKNKGKCSSECRLKCERLQRAIDKLDSPADQTALREVLKKKHCLHRELEYAKKHLCKTCKHNFDNHMEKKGHKKCVKCETCKHKPMHDKRGYNERHVERLKGRLENTERKHNEVLVREERRHNKHLEQIDREAGKQEKNENREHNREENRIKSEEENRETREGRRHGRQENNITKKQERREKRENSEFEKEQRNKNRRYEKSEKRISDHIARHENAN